MSSFEEALESISLKLGQKAKDAIAHYFNLLSEANSQSNLTRITDQNDFYIKHVFDSLLIYQVFPEIAEESFKVADIGCGGGIPGIPLSICFPELKIHEIDSVNKKIKHVQSFIDALKLNASAHHANARELARTDEFHRSFDIVIARAVADSHKLIKECKLFLNETGKMILYKTPQQIADEEKLVEREAKKAGLSVQKSAVIDIDGLGKRQFWVLSK